MFISTTRDWGNIVRDRRMDLGLSQAMLADQVGKARQWVVRFESGHAGSASLDSLLRLLDVLSLDLRVDVAPESEDSDSMFIDFDRPDGFER